MTKKLSLEYSNMLPFSHTIFLSYFALENYNQSLSQTSPYHNCFSLPSTKKNHFSLSTHIQARVFKIRHFPRIMTVVVNDL